MNKKNEMKTEMKNEKKERVIGISKPARRMEKAHVVVLGCMCRDCDPVGWALAESMK